MWGCPWEMSFLTILTEQILQRLCTNHLLWPSWLGHLCSWLLGLASSLITLSITLGRKELCPRCSEVSMRSEDTQLVKRGALLANFAKLLAQLSLLSSNLSQDQMDLEEQLNMTLTWPSASSVASAKKLALLTLSLKDQTSNTQHSSTRSCFTIRQNF